MRHSILHVKKNAIALCSQGFTLLVCSHNNTQRPLHLQRVQKWRMHENETTPLQLRLSPCTYTHNYSLLLPYFHPHRQTDSTTLSQVFSNNCLEAVEPKRNPRSLVCEGGGITFKPWLYSSHVWLPW